MENVDHHSINSYDNEMNNYCINFLNNKENQSFFEKNGIVIIDAVFNYPENEFDIAYIVRIEINNSRGTKIREVYLFYDDYNLYETDPDFICKYINDPEYDDDINNWLRNKYIYNNKYCNLKEAFICDS